MTEYKYIKYKTRYIKKCPNLASYSDVAENIYHVGSFATTDKIIAGESWNLELDMPTGIYNAYKSNKDLLIVHESNKSKINKDYLLNKIFTVVGDVGVDVGTFGFYDSGFIYKLIPKENNTIGGPTIPFFEIPEGKNETIVTSNSTANIKIDNKYKNVMFGVQSYTGTGDGFFKCLLNKKENIALLLAHET